MTEDTQLPLCTDNCISSEEYTKKAKQELIDMRKAKYAHLYKWVEWLKKEIPEEFIWYFDTSSPFGSEINVHIKSHKCIGTCFSLRFETDGQLKASDSHFMGGTHFLWGEKTEEDMREVVKRSVAKECNDSDWEDNKRQDVSDLYWKKLMKYVKLDGWIQRDQCNWDMLDEVNKELGIEDNE